MGVKLALMGILIFSILYDVRATDVTEHDASQERALSLQKRRLTLQNTADIQHCLLSAGDVGCGMFECFSNNTCEIRGLHDICLTFMHNAGRFDSQGKSFIKDALKCMAHGLRQRFSCVSRRCVAVKELVFQLQRQCYTKHNLCSAVRQNVNVMVEMIHFSDLFPKGPHVELVNILLGCGDEVREAIGRRIRTQCEVNWGALCASLSLCPLARGGADQGLTPAPATTQQHGNTLPPGGQLGEDGEQSWMEELLNEKDQSKPQETLGAAQPLQDNSTDTLKVEPRGIDDGGQ
ncbi:hypothetical protein AALO_G00030250 [Alosa alosa]|uniref:Stanniocalcin n=1 Tax=Alosa alosa TaxID=278164 RepID=A0AAV6HBL6_9TELE|nr:stanniocalcin-2 [Alosa sapidissima]XP_048093593.1 stanniocalcin-2 [Alosa alosa]KAG5284768.1 hypothetical protein AALO_G00030250 [Alosa alosa]